MTGKQPRRTARPGVDAYGRSPLHDAAARGDAAAVSALLAAGSDPDAADDNGWTPLHFAAQARSAAVAGLLLDAGARVDPVDAHGNTPLWRATFESRGDGAVIERLLAAGADPHAPNASGVSACQLADSIGNFDVRQFFAAVRS